GNGQGNGQGWGDDQGNGEGQGDGETYDRTMSIQSVVRAPGACALPGANARRLATFLDNTTSDFSDPAIDGTYCYRVAVTTAFGTTFSPGLSVVVATKAAPVATASPTPPAAPAAPAGVNSSGGIVAGDKVAPPSPGKLGFSVARGSGARVPVTVRWRNPAVADLDRVELLINRKHAPRSQLDGQVIYRGLADAVVVSLRAGQTAHFALYAVDHSGNVSAASRTVFSLARLIPMRPLSGSSLHAAPLLTWKPRKGAAYYNLQVFSRGKRVLTTWPQRAAYRFPAEKLLPGTYVWFVWPAVRRTGVSPRYADLIGRATFVYVH
ncbi:MAG: hypothetical protein QOI71_2233, partial [Gaiellales bacterium]|nr:hypothetical protein [Gaiellales bacterium]